MAEFLDGMGFSDRIHILTGEKSYQLPIAVFLFLASTPST